MRDSSASHPLHQTTPEPRQEPTKMSLASSPDCLFRPEDKALQILFPSVEDGTHFDEFFNEELYGLEQQEESSQPSDELFPVEHYVSDYPRLPSLPGSAVQERSPPQPWRKGLWCLNQAQPSRLTIEKTRKLGTGIVPTVHLVNNDNFAVRNSRSPAVSQAVNSTKRFATGPNAAKYRDKAIVPTPLLREATLSPSPMYAQLPLQAKMEQVETWQQDFQNFHLRMPSQHASTMSPVSPSRARNGRDARQMNAAIVAQNAGIGMAISTYDGFPDLSGYHDDKQHFLDPSMHSGISINQMPSPTAHTSVVMQQSSHDQHPTPVWTTESLHSSNSSHPSYETISTSLHSGQSARSGHDIFHSQVQGWWSPPLTTNKAPWHGPRRDCYPAIAAPAPQRAPAPAIVQNLDHANGLGIQYPELEQMESAVYHDRRSYYSTMAPGSSMPYSPTVGGMSHGIPPVPPLPYPNSHPFSSLSPFTTPRKQRRSPSRSPSPSLSPTSSTVRVLRQRSPTRTDHSQSRHRRKSIHKPGPIRDNAGEPLPSLHTRARSRSTSKPPRTPRTPKTPTGGFGAIDFVNFTPKDSNKLLSDVAPSGSSKTRARRDAEAREKRKKLSEAALKAVSSAGGDVEALKKAILT